MQAVRRRNQSVPRQSILAPAMRRSSTAHSHFRPHTSSRLCTSVRLVVVVVPTSQSPGECIEHRINESHSSSESEVILAVTRLCKYCSIPEQTASANAITSSVTTCISVQSLLSLRVSASSNGHKRETDSCDRAPESPAQTD